MTRPLTGRPGEMTRGARLRELFAGSEIRSRPQTVGEEIANAISHGLGLLAGILAAPLLLGEGARRGDQIWLAGSAIFAASVVILYFASTLYHALPPGRGKQIARIVDHSAIYLLIAGSYTPFTVGVLRGAWGWGLLAIIWTMALAGLLLKVTTGVRYPTASLLFYIAMGWAGVIAVRPLLLNMESWGLFWLLVGAASYMIGVVFYVIDERLRYSHFIWHLFVLGGTAAHYVAVIYYSG